MTAEEYFYNHWQKANRGKFGDYDSDEYATAFANDYAALRQHDVAGRGEQFYCWDGSVGEQVCKKQCEDCRLDDRSKKQ